MGNVTGCAVDHGGRREPRRRSRRRPPRATSWPSRRASYSWPRQPAPATPSGPTRSQPRTCLCLSLAAPRRPLCPVRSPELGDGHRHGHRVERRRGPRRLSGAPDGDRCLPDAYRRLWGQRRQRRYGSSSLSFSDTKADAINLGTFAITYGAGVVTGDFAAAKSGTLHLNALDSMTVCTQDELQAIQDGTGPRTAAPSPRARTRSRSVTVGH